MAYEVKVKEALEKRYVNYICDYCESQDISYASCGFIYWNFEKQCFVADGDIEGCWCNNCDCEVDDRVVNYSEDEYFEKIS